MTFIEFLILGLATWRVSSLLAEEEGPWYVLERLREKLGMFYDEFGQVQCDNQPCRQLTCIWCNSVLVGAAFFVFWLVAPEIALAIANCLALSTLAIMINARGVRARKIRT